MLVPEAHVRKVCLRNGEECSRLMRAPNGSGGEMFGCRKASKGRSLIESVFADEPGLLDMLKKIDKDKPAEGNCSGPPSFVEYT